MFEIKDIPIPVKSKEINPDFIKCSRCPNEAMPGFKFCQSCKDKNSIKHKKYYENNKELIAQKVKDQKLKDPDRFKKYKHKEYEVNKDRYKNYNKEYYLKNKENMDYNNKQYRLFNFKDLQKYRFKNKDQRHANYAKHRAKKHNAPNIESVNRIDVYKRDNYICQICKGLTFPHVHNHHPLYPTVDHIIPLSKNGNHEMSNVQCAHLICNSKKGNKI